MSLRWRIALGFALVALATAAVIALATPPIVTQGFGEIDADNDSGRPARAHASPPATGNRRTQASGATPAPTDAAQATARLHAQSPPSSRRYDPRAGPGDHDHAADPGRHRAPRPRASLFGLLAAGRLVRPLTRLEQAAVAVARGDLGRRSGLADRTDEFGQLGRTFDSMAGQLQARGRDAPSLPAGRGPRAQDASGGHRRHVQRDSRRRLHARAAPHRDDPRPVAGPGTDRRRPAHDQPGRRRPPAARTAAAGGSSACSIRSPPASRPGPPADSVKLSVEAPDGIIVDADPDRLRQMLGALVDNALRHTPEAARCESRSTPRDPGDAVRGGPPPGRWSGWPSRTPARGFPAEALPRIFERFYQADPSRSRGTGTSGLGLSIVRALAEAHGARVGAENRAEGGARLWIELPAVRIELRGLDAAVSRKVRSRT